MRRLLLSVAVPFALLFAAPVSAQTASPAPAPATSPAPASSASFSVNLDYRSFSPEQVRTRLKDACIYQRAQTSEKYASLAKGCRCYSEKLIAAMTPEEIDAWKTTRTLNASAKAKAEQALAACPQ